MRIESMFQIIQRKHRRRPLGAVPVPSRFSDPSGVFEVVFAAQTVRCAFWESLGRNRFNRRKRRQLPKAEVEARLVVSLRSTAFLELVDLRGDGPIRIGATAAVTHDSNHAAR